MIKNQIYITKQLQSRLSLDRRYDLDRKLRAVIKLFPELDAERIEVGLTTATFTHAAAKTNLEDRIKIVYNPLYPITYFTLGHELTHFVQHLDEEETGIKIPYGEVQCDVWTLARDELFLDAQPFYLRLPKRICDDWRRYSKQVRELCIKAIEVRKTKRQYLRWLERELLKLAPLVKR
ncbi:hypothetical protein [ANMV-1 virus]|nr:hypothetical protein [ANMV-1 virus]